MSATGNVVALVAGAFAIAGISIPTLTVAAVVLTGGGFAYTLNDLYKKRAEISAESNTAFLSAKTWTWPRDPLILDLDGDGLETVGLASNVYFDHDGDGVL
ncbi:MAG: hypothetical protein QM569_04035, partial [Acidovorax sp.]|uniref:hypothetical protein n=1 Tax=Acidovorax sp. TaxID=1872122 RepID=UPI0039E2FBC8